MAACRDETQTGFFSHRYGRIGLGQRWGGTSSDEESVYQARLDGQGWKLEGCARKAKAECSRGRDTFCACHLYMNLKGCYRNLCGTCDDIDGIALPAVTQ